MKYLIIFLLSSLSISVFAQSFPGSWQGTWEGTVHVWANDTIINSFPMSLSIAPTDSFWTYIINYGHTPGKPDIRKYSIRKLNDSIGHYAIDEHNGIVLDTYKMGNCLMSSFGGLGSELYTRTCKKGDVLEYEITSVYSEPERVSGDIIMNGDSIPKINSYRVYNLMKAQLHQKK